MSEFEKNLKESLAKHRDDNPLWPELERQVERANRAESRLTKIEKLLGEIRELATLSR